MNTTHDHTWFTEQIATYLADGLEGDERARFESHAAACPACAAELERARADERRLMEMFDDAAPQAGFEDRIITTLRTQRPRLTIPTWATKALATAAAVVIVGGVGYVAMEQVQVESRGRAASNLRQIGQAILIYSNDAKGPRERTSYTATLPAASAAEPFAGEVDKLAAGLREMKRGNSNNHDEDGQNVLRLDKHVEFQSNPFVGVQRDNIYARRGGGSQQIQMGAGAATPMATDSGIVNGAIRGGQTDAFKPTEFALGGLVEKAGKDVALTESTEARRPEIEPLGRAAEQQPAGRQTAGQQPQQPPPPVQ